MPTPSKPTSEPKMSEPQKEANETSPSKEDKILTRLDNIQQSIDKLQLSYSQQTEELLTVKRQNIMLSTKIKKLEADNFNLSS